MPNRRETPDLMAEINAPNVLDELFGVTPNNTAILAQLRYDYTLIPEAERAHVQRVAVEIVRNGRKAQESLITIGLKLREVKDVLEHGQFSDWCTTEFDMSQRTAQRMMQVAETFGGKSDTVSFLSDSALYLLSAPSTPEAARVEIIAEAQATHISPTKAQVQEVITRHQPPQPAYAEIWQLQSVVGELKCSADQLRHAAKEGNQHFVWGLARDAVDSKSLRWRKADLVQALNNVAAQMEAREAGTNRPNLGTGTQPATPIIRVTDSDLFELAERSQCADIIGANKIRNPFSFAGKFWVSPAGNYNGRSGTDERICVRVYDGSNPAIQPGERPGTFTKDAYPPGTIVEWRSSKYTLGAEWLIVQRVRTTPATSDATPTPATLPADLVARGWELRQLVSGRYYCNNANGPRATRVFDDPAEAIAAARGMQIDVVVADTLASDGEAGPEASADSASAIATAGEGARASLASGGDDSGGTATAGDTDGAIAIHNAWNFLTGAVKLVEGASVNLTGINHAMCEEIDAVLYDLRRMVKALV